MNKPLAICVLGMTLFHGLANAKSVEIGPTDAEGTRLFLDSIMTLADNDLNLRRVNVLTEYAKERGVGKQKYLRMAQVGVINCDHKTFTKEKLSLTTANVEEIAFREYGPYTVEPARFLKDTAFWNIMTLVCNFDMTGELKDAKKK